MARKLAMALVAVGTAWSWLPVGRGPVAAQTADPCILTATAGAARATPSNERERKYGRFGNDSRDIRELLNLSSMASQARARAAAVERAQPARDRDENHIAILEDTNGELILRENQFDLAGIGLRFQPVNDGYTVRATNNVFRSTLGTAVALTDDDSAQRAIPFPFRFYGQEYTSLFINSDGNMTFGEGDNASTERSTQRAAGGAPRIAPFFADLDPSVSGGVFVDAALDAMTITWCSVPGFGLSQTVTVQAVLAASGTIDFRYRTTELTDGIVAVSPGGVAHLTGVDLNRVAGEPFGHVALGERFTLSPSLDLVAATRRFYERHADDFDQLVFWTDTPVMTDAFAFESTVRNAIEGIGVETFDFSSALGGARALQSVVNMDDIRKYSDQPEQRLIGENSTLGVLAHEVGHRWLARLQFSNVDRQPSDQLLGRQRAHWSFFLDSDGSVMEGNEIQDLGGGMFRTESAAEKYSLLDQYAMGLVAAADVPGWFFVDSPISNFDREDQTRGGITLRGTRRDVIIQDVIEVLGPRVPSADESPRVHRLAFVYVTSANAFRDEHLARLGRIREQFGPFFSRATGNRMAVRTTLTP